MPSQTIENYLKVIYSLDDKSKKLSISNIAKDMEVSLPTANSMIKRLTEAGYIEYQKYRDIKITNKGRREAANIVRKHRLSEMFLVKEMGIGWELVHEIAEEMEHIKSSLFFDKIDEILSYPKIDPHGSPIPDKEGNISSKNYIKLNQARIGLKVVLRSLLNTNSELLIFLNQRNIQLGTVLEIIRKEPFDESILVSYFGVKELNLSAEVSKCLLVEKA